MGNQNPYIKEEQTSQWPKEKKDKKDKQRSTKHTHKNKKKRLIFQKIIKKKKKLETLIQVDVCHKLVQG
jgi:hypothetical protein